VGVAATVEIGLDLANGLHQPACHGVSSPAKLAANVLLDKPL